MNIDVLLHLINVLIIPLVIYLVKIEKRLTRLETKMDIFCERNCKKAD